MRSESYFCSRISSSPAGESLELSADLDLAVQEVDLPDAQGCGLSETRAGKGAEPDECPDPGVCRIEDAPDHFGEGMVIAASRLRW